MSMSSGAAGAFGIMLSTIPEFEDVYNKFKAEVVVLEEKGGDLESLIREDDEELKGILSKYQTLFSALLHTASGVIVPSSATLHYTGLEDDRPADGATPAEEWVLGFGIYTKPWEYPEMFDSFRTAADYHMWAWVG
jgi:hypothetical protein